jgi:hypothetical protein
MLPILTNFKSQLQANKAKSALLGALLCVAAVVTVRNVLAPHPQITTAGPMRLLNTQADNTDPDMPTLSPKEMKEKLAESKALWQILRETRGVPPAQAFAFDPAYYNLDPSVAPPKVDPVVVQTAPSTAPNTAPKVAVIDEQARIAAVKDQARALVLQSTVLGAQPGAIINSGVFHLDDNIGGFRIVAIRARQVMVEKDGVTLAIEMAK